jgi:CDP-diacylglycerol--serine O-phosphatidyltransferase
MLVVFKRKMWIIICFFEKLFMQKIRRNIPNAITCGNLLCGCLALEKAFEGNLVMAGYLVGIAVVFDFFDGFAARMLHVSSAIGKDLDSLADMVTFGVVPGVVMFKLLSYVITTNFFLENSYGPLTAQNSSYYLAYLAFMIPVFSAIRLAKFNNDTRQTTSFIGLPTPANAIFICSIPLVMQQITAGYSAVKNPFEVLMDVSSNPVLALLQNHWFLIGLTVLCSFLLVAELPLFALKFNFFGWKGNEIRYIFLGSALLLLSLFQFVGIPLTILLYIILSLVHNFLNRQTSGK